MSGRHLLAALAGSLTMFVLGFLVYGLALASFLQANAGSAAGALRDPPLIWAIAAGNVAYAVFLTLLLRRTPSADSFGQGLRFGGAVGFLTSLASSLTQYATHDVANLAATLVNPIAFAALAGVAGGVVAIVLGRER